MAKTENPWIDRNSLEVPEDGQQVLADLQGVTRADDKFIVTRYNAAKDLFSGEGFGQKVVRWMPILEPGRRIRVDWDKWRDTFGERSSR